MVGGCCFKHPDFCRYHWNKRVRTTM